MKENLAKKLDERGGKCRFSPEICAHIKFLDQELRLGGRNYPLHQMLAESIEKQRNNVIKIFTSLKRFLPKVYPY